ncbi:MAG: threonine/serine exporter family protein [Proteobacteria bacterium]|nr:threonine/serine exporter family protein [Pseudomonadota bacterium]
MSQAIPAINAPPAPNRPASPHAGVPYGDRVAFVVELAKRLHNYGTTAQRLEGAIGAVARRLGLRCHPWSNPTGLILSFSDAATASPLHDTTQVIRLEPGGVDLNKLCAADAIAEDVMAGRSDLRHGAAALHALDVPLGRPWLALETLCFGLLSASVAGLLRNSWADIISAGLIGLMVGALQWASIGRPRMQEAGEAIAAFVATLLAAAIATFLIPLTTKTVVIAAIIVLMPGLSLTNAVSELSSQHLVSGMARFGGALATLIKLTFGTVAAMQLVRVLGWRPHEAVEHRVGAWVEWAALLVSAYTFAVLFRAARRDYLLVIASAVFGYLVTRWVGSRLGNDAGVFFGSMAISAASNVYARWARRPGALVRVPGIVLLVPGSVSFRSLTFVLERDLMLGLNTAVAVLSVLVALVAGVLFGNLLVSARRNL